MFSMLISISLCVQTVCGIHLQVVDTDAQLSTSALLNRVQQCFAVRAGADEFLDVARSSFCRITDKVKVEMKVKLKLNGQGGMQLISAVFVAFPKCFLCNFPLSLVLSKVTWSPWIGASAALAKAKVVSGKMT